MKKQWIKWRRYGRKEREKKNGTNEGKIYEIKVKLSLYTPWRQIQSRCATPYILNPKSSLGRLFLRFLHADHTQLERHSRWDSSERAISSSQKELPTQHTSSKTKKNIHALSGIFFLPVRGFTPLIHFCTVLNHFVIHVTLRSMLPS